MTRLSLRELTWPHEPFPLLQAAKYVATGKLGPYRFWAHMGGEQREGWQDADWIGAISVLLPEELGCHVLQQCLTPNSRYA